MAARTTDEILDQILRLLPPRYAAMEPVLAGGAAGLAEAEAFVAELVDASTIEGAEGVFLRLRARGFGVYPQGDETDASIRRRIRVVNDQVTKPAILSAMDLILADYTNKTSHILERKDGVILDDVSAVDEARLVGWNQFHVVLPIIGDEYTGEVVLDDWVALDDLVAMGGGDGWHPAYLAIFSLLLRIRAAGIRVTVSFKD